MRTILETTINWTNGITGRTEPKDVKIVLHNGKYFAFDGTTDLGDGDSTDEAKEIIAEWLGIEASSIA
jgi:hypothetical protein